MTAKATRKPVAKNIVICLDGTGNQIEANISNVLKIYRAADKNGTDRQPQCVFYHPGVGTIGLKRPWSPFTQSAKQWLGLATGYGLDDQVLAAYRFIIGQYREQPYTRETKTKTGTIRKTRLIMRDRIFIFGYSRGAYAARVLAGLIHRLGVLTPNQAHLAGAAMTAYKLSDDPKQADPVDEFNRITQPKFPAIEMLGLFDTVGSVITPRPDRFYWPSLRHLPHTRNNPSVKALFEAASIDEPRRMFRLEPWDEGQTHRREEHSAATAPQIVDRVWFPGHHGDVGGGNPRKQSGLSQGPYLWLAAKAKAAGVVINTKTHNYVGGLKLPTPGTKYEYPEPSPTAKIHPSRGWFWTFQEYLPKRYDEATQKAGFRKRFLGLPFYVPRWEPRFIPPGAQVHISARQRSEGMDYAPVNRPEDIIEIK